jgi:hypothetical protein
MHTQCGNSWKKGSVGEATRASAERSVGVCAFFIAAAPIEEV